jgi:alpha-tubulin suppressor-like RCC1 family protein
MGEVQEWGPCEGEQLVCGNPVSDAGNSKQDGAAPADGGATRNGPADLCPQLSVGAAHACAITPAGGVKCWGTNLVGELGSGSTSSTNAPVDVVGLTSGVACIAAGEEHTCALTTAGAVKCWGEAISNGSSTNSTAPVDVPGLSSNVVGLASGESDTCAILEGGAVKCWGPGGEDEKDPTTNYGATPTAIAGIPSNLAAIAAGDGVNCLRTSAGQVQCWGGNSMGELGNGTTTPSATPVTVTGLGWGATFLSANGGPSACVVLSGGHVQCWGSIPGQAQSTTPVDVPGLTSGVATVSVGGEAYACAVMTSGTVQCWGQLLLAQSTPLTPVGIDSAVYVAANEVCACAMLSNNEIWCWGVPLPGGYGSCVGDGKDGQGSYVPPAEVIGF